MAAHGRCERLRGRVRRRHGIEPQRLSATQVDNLVLLGKVWGFAKYHHPRVTRGEVHWDYELFRILPKVLSAPDRTSAARLGRQGELEPCVDCGTLEGDPHLMPDIEWIHDRATLGPELSRRLPRRPEGARGRKHHRGRGRQRAWIPLPGNVSTMISGIGVFYPDRTPTQRVGIVPDLVVRPTAAGIREGRDEVLEAAVSHALGREWRLTDVRM